jgi:hypothetical protein
MTKFRGRYNHIIIMSSHLPVTENLRSAIEVLYLKSTLQCTAKPSCGFGVMFALTAFCFNISQALRRNFQSSNSWRMRCTLQKYQQFSPRLPSSLVLLLTGFSMQGLLVSDVMPFCAAALHRGHSRAETSWPFLVRSLLTMRMGLVWE